MMPIVFEPEPLLWHQLIEMSLQTPEDPLWQAAAALWCNRVSNPIHVWLAQRYTLFYFIS